MKENNLEQFLRDNKPIVREDPAFLLETTGRMDRVEGLKKEMDRQHRNGRRILLVTLVVGLLTGIAVCSLAYLHHVNLVQAGKRFEQFFQMLYGVKEYLALSTGILFLILCIVLSKTDARLFSR